VYGSGTYSADGIKAIAQAISVMASVTSIDVGNNNIGQAASLELLAAMKGKNMVTIGMAGCSLGVEGSKVVAEMISVMASMTECMLRGNELGVEGWTTIFNALCDSPASRISTWDLSGEKLGPEIAEPLANYISVTASVTSVTATIRTQLELVNWWDPC
jgi:Ran GTPase-activating protein (RanGAP) involved in mRNA processing and transport